jgi:methanogenic corrinoid protein MtbC1
MDRFSISQLSKYSGIKPHTIRIWEKRYNALSPMRSDGNTRYYNGNQLRRLLNIVSLKDEEPNIALLCSYSDAILDKKVKTLLLESNTRRDTDEYFISQLISSGIHFDEPLFNEVFERALSTHGAEKAYIQVFYPLLQRIGILWSSNEMAIPGEHFISNLLRQKFYSLIDSTTGISATKETWLLFLKENEFHELGLLFAFLMLKKAGRRVIYFGTNTPFNSLIRTAKEIKVTHLLTFQVQNEEIAEFQKYIKDLAMTFSDSKIHVSTNITTLQQPSMSNVILLHSLFDLQKVLKK